MKPGSRFCNCTFVIGQFCQQQWWWSLILIRCFNPGNNYFYICSIVCSVQKRCFNWMRHNEQNDNHTLDQWRKMIISIECIGNLLCLLFMIELQTLRQKSMFVSISNKLTSLKGTIKNGTLLLFFLINWRTQNNQNNQTVA